MTDAVKTAADEAADEADPSGAAAAAADAASKAADAKIAADTAKTDADAVTAAEVEAAQADADAAVVRKSAGVTVQAVAAKDQVAKTKHDAVLAAQKKAAESAAAAARAQAAAVAAADASAKRAVAAQAGPAVAFRSGFMFLPVGTPPPKECTATQIDGTPYYWLSTPSVTCFDGLALATPIATQRISRRGQSYTDANFKPVKVNFVFDKDGKDVTKDPSQGKKPFTVVRDDNTIVRSDDLTTPPSVCVETAAQARAEAHVDDSDNLVIVDLIKQSVLETPPRNVVKPNRGLTVVVCSDPAMTVTVSWGGQRGLTRADVAPPPSGSNAQPGAKAVGEATPPPAVYSEYTFSPRQAGSADVTITDTASKTSMAVELQVDTLYWGAVRFGIGTLFGHWRSYAITTAAGSTQPEITSSADGANFELVVGFAPYVFDDLLWGGRSQTGPGFSGLWKSHGRAVFGDVYIAPYLGFGVVNFSSGTVQTLSSLHLGGELEIADNLSIAVTAVYRRTPTLVAGYGEGSPVASGTTINDVTVDHWKWGVAVVLNATPSFLNFATGGGK